MLLIFVQYFSRVVHSEKYSHPPLPGGISADAMLEYKYGKRGNCERKREESILRGNRRYKDKINTKLAKIKAKIVSKE
jgi:hypothetical protein